MIDYLLHLGIGGLGALTGAYARGYCTHRVHQIVLGVSLVAAEAAITVPLVG